MDTNTKSTSDQRTLDQDANARGEDPMKIGLKSGYVFECEDDSFTETNKYSGELIHIFVSLKDRKKFTVNDEDIEFFESDLLNADIEELATYGDDYEDDDIDPSYV